MDPTIVAALISAATALMVATLPYAVKGYQGIRRVRRFCGIWTGKGSQSTERNNAAREYTVRLGINSKNKITLTLERHDTEFSFTNNLECKVLSIDTDFLLMQYRNPRPEVRQFGSILFGLSSDGRTLSGILVGYGIRSEETVTGTMILSRI